ncbi:hypothetical protein [Paludisphaera rhizosphaerae]|uniref:hypothetical protein n=1 Tax=Paludisphaera rhizosphaerae TaxID=2711216 RepID=UPI0013EA57D8|nr:hypothetical protein [Paludisphaera rhizosphaerae]
MVRHDLTPDNTGPAELRHFRARWGGSGFPVMERDIVVSPTDGADEALGESGVRHPDSYCRINVPTLGVVVFVECPWRRGELEFAPGYLAGLAAFDRAFESLMDDAQVVDDEGRFDG